MQKGKTRKMLTYIIPTVAFTLIFGFALACGGSGSSTKEVSKVEKEEIVEEKTEAVEEAKTKEEAEIGSKENSYSINESITINNEVNWKILSAEDLGNTLEAIDRWSDDKTTTGKFIKVRFTVKNIGKEVNTITDLRLFDNEDREFMTYSSIFGYIEEGEELLIADNINPGLERTYTVIYEVPTDSKGFILEVTNLEFMSDKAYISLGF